SVITGNRRDFALGSVVDVRAGETVTAPTLALFHPDAIWEPRSPSWSSDGSTLTYAYGFNSLFGIDAEPEPLDFGASLLAEEVEGAPNIVLFLARGPTSETANQILHQGSLLDSSEGIWITAEGSGILDEPLVTYDVFSTINGLAWLPDGSGFAYSVSGGDVMSADKTGDLIVFDVASGQAQSVADLEGDFAGLVSVSGDGSSIVFERSDELDSLDETLVDPDLWIVGRDGSGLRLLVEHARAPAWSR
ncbi:MAG: hypothetical protein H0V04_01270, partial [Chloroflexi bacterium]|nr:hypothetical protein [Chloroflexota bacterium]